MKKNRSFLLIFVVLNCALLAMQQPKFPLHEAVKSGTIEQVIALISNVTVNQKDDHQLTPLHYAARKLDLDVARLLLESGANVNARDKYGCTPLGGVVDVCCYACGSPCGEEACSDEQLLNATHAMAMLLLDHGASLNDKFGDGNTSFCWAVYRNQIKVVELFIERGADVNLRDKDGLAPLHRALHECNGTIARLLIEAPGIDINRPMSNGFSPLMLALRFKMPKTVQLLISRGADVNYVEPRGWAPLHCAVAGGNLESVKLLLGTRKINLNAGCGVGTPLSLAMSRGFVDMARLIRLTPARVFLHDARFCFLLSMMAKPANFFWDDTVPLTSQVAHRLPLHITHEICSYLRPEACAYDNNLVDAYDRMYQERVQRQTQALQCQQNNRWCIVS